MNLLGNLKAPGEVGGMGYGGLAESFLIGEVELREREKDVVDLSRDEDDRYGMVVGWLWAYIRWALFRVGALYRP